MNKTKCGVYKITCIPNGKIYIGSSKNIYKRWEEHIYELNNHRHCNMFLQKDWDKYGQSEFKFEIIEETEEYNRFEVEQEYIDKFLPYYRNGNGYNISENSLRQNFDGMRIYKDKYIRLNPFYKASKSKIKEMLKQQDEFGNYIYSNYREDNINTTSYHEWFDNLNDICFISYDGMFGKHHVREVDSDYVDNTSREDILWDMMALDTYEYLRDYAIECGCYDDYE